jgi:TonB family protein
MVLRSSAIVLVGLLLMPLLRRQSAALRHWVLLTALVCASTAPAASWLLPRWQPRVEVTSLVPRPLAQSTQRFIPQPRFPDDLPARGGAGSFQSFDAGSVIRLWALGTLMWLTVLAVGVVRLWRVDRGARPVDNLVWLEALARLRRERTSQVRVRVTSHSSMPLVWGLRRPSIILPTAALSWSDDRVRAVLRHELAHIERHDWCLLLVSETIRAAYWFNPLVWMTCRRLRTECEIACDDVAITGGAETTDYAAHVVAIARELQAQRWLPAPAIVRTSTLERRVRAMLNKTANRDSLSARARSTTLAALTALMLAVAGVATQSFVSLSGVVVDPSNAVLPGVKLVLVNEQSQAKYEIQTDRQGRYEFVGLPPGNYTFEAAIPGFTRFSGLVAVATQNLQQDVTLSVGMVQETVTLVQDAGPPPVDPERQRRLDAAKQQRAEQALATAGGRRRIQTPDGAPIGGNVRPPLRIRDVRPQFPAALRGSEGDVVLRARISTTGNVENIDVVSSSHPEFTQSAIDAIGQWQFDATLLNGDPIATPMQVTVRYRTR